jgi:hypothetical protein
MVIRRFLDNVATYLLARKGAAFGQYAVNFPLLLVLPTSGINDSFFFWFLHLIVEMNGMDGCI